MIPARGQGQGRFRGEAEALVLTGTPGCAKHCPEPGCCVDAAPQEGTLPPRGPEDAEVAEVTGATGARGQASRACLVAAGSEQVVSKGIIGFYSALFKKKGQAIELCRLIRLN